MADRSCTFRVFPSNLPLRIVNKHIHVGKVLISSPLLSVERDREGYRLNLAAISRRQSAAQGANAPSNPLALNIDTIR